MLVLRNEEMLLLMEVCELVLFDGIFIDILEFNNLELGIGIG